MLFFGCNSDDDNTPIVNLTNEFIIDDLKTYLTPNGYFEEYLSNGKVAWYALKLIDGEFTPILDPEEQPCPYVENLNHGVSIWLRLDHDKKLEPGFYNYSSSENNLGILNNSEVFYGFKFVDSCFGLSETVLKIVDGNLKVEKENHSYAISYLLISDDGVKIEGTYFGKLTIRTVPEW